ncbi:hypothetical protein C0966_17040 (plasmid) [Bacillus methanolicus]|uniref:hypothetical protein n=1 Tax=Bacillus methanolicus TaxID=1471 RepID=UPI00238084B3|nr:hypothetical protein [Bacillus methanolicus]MDE3840973.1 hypothetical protein [Bacillus methanolicus]
MHLAVGLLYKLEAAENVYRWLGWQYGRFTEETKKAALNHLILSALSEGLSKKTKKLSNAVATSESIPVSHNKNGQLAFVI